MHLCQWDHKKPTATLTGPEDCNCFAVRSAARHVTRLYDQLLAPVGLRVTQFSILAKLKRLGPLTINALAEAMVMDRTTLGRDIQPLERDGLIRIEPAPSDRRAKVLHLTKSGEKRLQAGLKAWWKAQARFEAGFGSERAAELRTLLRAIVTSQFQEQDIQAAGVGLDRKVLILNASNEREIEAAFLTMTEQRAAGLLVTGDPFFNSRREKLVALASRQAIAAIYEWREFALAGGLMTYGSSVTDAYRQAGRYAGRILKGEKPSDLPILQPTKFDLLINLKTAKTLGLEIPAKLLALADEVIE